ncbi:MAG: hypothetical protein JW990_07725 [Thermoleophilia bacterium]|nr:hypothetical protein [Thermoleophilia bacterium]
MRVQTITAPSLLVALAALFDQTCTVQKNTPTADAVGQMADAWTDLAGHVNLPCRVAPVPADRDRRPRVDMTVTTISHIVCLPGAYPGITTTPVPPVTAMRVVYSGANYQIVNVIRDSELLMTELEVEQVTT